MNQIKRGAMIAPHVNHLPTLEFGGAKLRRNGRKFGRIQRPEQFASFKKRGQLR